MRQRFRTRIWSSLLTKRGGVCGGVTPALQGLTQLARMDCACAAGWRVRSGGTCADALVRRFAAAQVRVEVCVLSCPTAPPAALGCSRAGWGVSGERCSLPLFSWVHRHRSWRGIVALSLTSTMQAKRQSTAYAGASQAPRWKLAALLQKTPLHSLPLEYYCGPRFLGFLFCILRW